jgi:hypothetical protein
MSYKNANTHYGQALYSKGTNVRSAPNTSASVIYTPKSGELIGFGTRRLFSDPVKSYWIEVISSRGTGWVRADAVSGRKRKAPTVKDGDGKAAVESILKADKQTFKNLLYVSELFTRLQQAGKDVTPFEELYKKVSGRYNARQNKIRNTKNITLSFINSSVPGFGWLIQKFTSGISGAGHIGVIQLAALVPVAIYMALGALSATAVYLLFKDDLIPATVDLDQAETLAKVLEQVDTTTKQKVLGEINNQLKDVQEQSYQSGKSNSTFGEMKTILFGLAAFYAADKFIFSKK